MDSLAKSLREAVIWASDLRYSKDCTNRTREVSLHAVKSYLDSVLYYFCRCFMSPGPIGGE